MSRHVQGYALAALAAALWAANAPMAKTLLHDDLGWARLSQLRSAGSLLILVLVLAVLRRDLLRVDRRDLPALAFLGTAGLAAVHASYFASIDRLKVGVAVTIQYLAPLLVLVWLRVVHKRRPPRSLWGAVALSIVGSFFVVQAYDAGSLDGLGLLAAVASMVTFAIYMVGSERAGHRHQPVTTLVYAFGFATLLWAIVQPWWSFPVDRLDSPRNALLGAGVIVVGTLLPFVAMVAALRRIPSARAGVVATLEPVLGALFAWVFLGEDLAAAQLAGGAVVVAAVVWVQANAPDLEAEAAPVPARSRVRPA